LTTQHLTELGPGMPTVALVLSPQGHVEHALYLVDDGEALTAHVEPGAAPALVDWLDRMRFLMRVEVADVTEELAVAWRPNAGYDLVPRERLEAYAEAAGPAAGLWAYEALRIARGEPRIGQDTDHRTIPNEVGWIGASPWEAVHLDGSLNRLPEQGSPLLLDDRQVGFVGSSARHHELGPIALALVKRAVPVDATLDASGIPAAQEVVVDPEVGLHVRPLR
jgi:folate-binding Fe-S cluster repair protein YgfZ